MFRKKSPLAEKRLTKRRFMSYYMRVFDAEAGRQIDRLVDITHSGTMLISEEPLPKGKAYRLRLELTEDVAGKPFLEFAAPCIWCRPDTDPQRYNISFEVAALTAADM